MNYSDEMAAILGQINKPTGDFKKNDNNGLSGKERMAKMFNPRVDKSKGEQERFYQIRIVPDQRDENGNIKLDKNGKPISAFKEVEHHEIKVGKNPVKLVCPEAVGRACIICETEQILRSSGQEDQMEKAKQFRKRPYYIVRIIERGKEHEGIKFWRFRRNFQGKGEMDKIKAKLSLGINIADPTANGWDLHIVCGLNAQGYSAINDITTIDRSPLAETQEEIDKLINDPLVWSDIFVVKDDDYLHDVAAGKAKYWDDTLRKYVTPSDPEASPINDEKGAVDSNFVEETAKGLNLGGNQDTTATIDAKLANSSDSDDEDLPF